MKIKMKTVMLTKRIKMGTPIKTPMNTNFSYYIHDEQSHESVSTMVRWFRSMMIYDISDQFENEQAQVDIVLQELAPHTSKHWKYKNCYV